MRDQSSGFLNINELKFSRQKGYLDKSLFMRLLIGSLMVCALFVILHFREVRVEIEEVGSKASSYVVAQVDFDFFDEEATLILRQQAVRDIGKIYKLNESDINEARVEFENFLIYNQDWRSFAEISTFDEMYLGVAAVEKDLLHLKFTDSRTLSRLKEVNILGSNRPSSLPSLYAIYTPTDLDEEIVLPDVVWEQVVDTLNKKYPQLKSAISFVIAYLENKKWRMEEDIPDEDQVRKTIASLVAPK